jgi:hypothetical protein
MSYCFQDYWVSAFTYKKLLQTFGAGPDLMSSGPQPLTTQGNYWHVSGTIDGGTATVLPLFTFNTKGTTAAGSGAYRIDVENGPGTVLYTRFFDPIDVHDWTTGPRHEGLAFTELVPVTGGAARIVVRGPGNAALATVPLGGATPTANITFPTAGLTLNGPQTITWTVNDADGGSHWYLVDYSADGGATWQPLTTDVDETSLRVDFNELPGSAGNARVRVSVTDGANTSTSTSGLFTVGKKPPAANIVSPATGLTFEKGQLVWLQGTALDPEQGYLPSGSLAWSSNLDGALGAGDELHVTDLSLGTHTITLTATDADSNQSSDTITVTIADHDGDNDGFGANDATPGRSDERGGGTEG